jgi:hypothetical protein
MFLLIDLLDLSNNPNH